MNTRIAKGRDGWQAQTNIDVGNGRTARISTGKTSGGKLQTHVSVGISGNDGIFETFTHAMFKDYSKCFASEKVRCTDKSVEAQHALVLGNWETIRADITRFYNAEPALVA